MEIKQSDEGERFNLISRSGHRTIQIWWSEIFNCWMAKNNYGIEFEIKECKQN